MIIEGLSQLNLAEIYFTLKKPRYASATTHSLYLHKNGTPCPRSTELQSQVSPPCFTDHPLRVCVCVCTFTGHNRKPFRSELSGTHNGCLQTRDQFNNYKPGKGFSRHRKLFAEIFTGNVSSRTTRVYKTRQIIYLRVYIGNRSNSE